MKSKLGIVVLHTNDLPLEWFRQVVETEIGPLLDEYWFDALDKAQDARKRLTEGFKNQ